MADPASHAQDAIAFHVPELLVPGGAIELPIIPLGFYDLQLTKYMVIEVMVAVSLVAIFLPLAGMIRTGRPPKGRFWNLFEVFLVFVRDEIARPMIGKKDADPYLPFLWTLFFFVLFCNLFGMIPWLGSPTGSIGTTALLAVVTFGVVLFSGMRHHGPVKFWVGLVPHMELPLLVAVFLKPLLFCIEVFAFFVKHAVLAIRLWANMFAGHVVLAVFLSFIVATAGSATWLWGTVTVLSIIMSIGISLLELLVAFLQAYIFTFLAALYIGGAIHQH